MEEVFVLIVEAKIELSQFSIILAAFTVTPFMDGRTPEIRIENPSII